MQGCENKAENEQMLKAKLCKYMYEATWLGKNTIYIL
jgi:hypothetical protein